MYHSISDKANLQGGPDCLDLVGMVVTTKFFEDQIRFISQNYTVIPIDQYINHVTNKDVLPSNPLLITFDDGFLDNYLNAVPILEKYGCTATFFIIGNAVDASGDVILHRLYYAIDKLKQKVSKIKTDNYGEVVCDVSSKAGKLTSIKDLRKAMATMKPEEKISFLNEIEKYSSVRFPEEYKNIYMSDNHLMDIIKRGFKVGGHTMSHPNLKLLSKTDIQEEVTEMIKILKKYDISNTQVFAYPYGQKNNFNDEAKACIKEANYSCAMTTIEGLNYSKTDQYELKRIEVGNISNYELLTHTLGLVGSLKNLAKKCIGKE